LLSRRLIKRSTRAIPLLRDRSLISKNKLMGRKSNNLPDKFMGEKDFSLNGLLETADELISQGGPVKDCIRACKALEFFPKWQWHRCRELVLCGYRDLLANGVGDFEDYRFICEGGQKYWKNQPEIAINGLHGMIRTAEKPKQRRIIRRNIRLMKAMGWNTK
jgi:hypothetical protein